MVSYIFGVFAGTEEGCGERFRGGGAGGGGPWR